MRSRASPCTGRRGRKTAVARLDDQRCAAIGRAKPAFTPVRGAASGLAVVGRRDRGAGCQRAANTRFFGGKLLPPLLELFVGERGALAEIGSALERCSGDVRARPDALDIGITPGSSGVRPRRTACGARAGWSLRNQVDGRGGRDEDEDTQRTGDPNGHGLLLVQRARAIDPALPGPDHRAMSMVSALGDLSGRLLRWLDLQRVRR